MDYLPGQSVAIESPARPRLWRYYSMANAPRPDGLLEFHIRLIDGGAVSMAPVGAIKSIANDPLRLRVLGICWGGEDAYGDRFERGVTDLGVTRDIKGTPVYWAHARDGIKGRIGQVEFADETDRGIDFTVVLDQAEKYLRTIAELVRRKKLGASTGSASHLVVRRGGVLRRWPIVELSLLPDPAEIRTLGQIAVV